MSFRFEVLDGKHTDREGTVYKKGDVVEHPARLDRLYGPQKFKKLGKDETPGGEVQKAAIAAKKAKGLKVTATSPAVETDSKAGREMAENNAELTGNHGKDTSDEFRRASEYGLKVYSRGGHYYVHQEGSDVALNERGLAHEKVNKFIKDYMEK